MHRQSDWKRKAGRLSFFLSDANQDTGVRDTPPVLLYSDESVADLSRDGLRLIQPVKGFRFGEDTVLLSDFAARLYDDRPRKSIRVADLGAGSGASSILLMARLPAARVLAVELDPHSFSALERNRQLNRLDDRLEVMQADYCRWAESLPDGPGGSSLRAVFDLVIVNPPYGLPGPTNESGHLGTPHPGRVSAREEQTMSLEAMVRVAACLLRPHGQLAIVHRTNRLTDVMTALRFHRIEPKSLRLVQSVERRPPLRFLMSAVSQARPGSLVVEPPLIVRDVDRHLSEELVRIYGNTAHMTTEALYDGLTETGIPWQSSS